MTFEGKVVAITGAAGGVGRSLCRYFIDEGAKVAAIDKKASCRRASLPTLKRAPRRSLMLSPISANLRRSSAHSLRWPARWGQSTFSSTTPAARATEPLPAPMRPDGGRISRSIWTAPIICAQAVIPGMVAEHSGVIINIGSVNGLGALGDPAYSAGKAAMISLTRSLAQEYGPYGVRANIVLPGTIRTPALGEARRQGSQGPGNAPALVSSWAHRRACRYRESGRFPGVRRRLGDHRRGPARWTAA